MNMPLKEVLLVLDKRDVSQIKAYDYFGASTSGGFKAQALMKTLRSAGVLCSPIKHTVEACVSGWGRKTKTETIGPLLAGVEILDQPNIDRFKQQGGVLWSPETLKNVEFNQVSAGKVSTVITSKNEPAILDAFIEQGIKHLADKRQIRVDDPISICAVVLSGAKFPGARCFVEKHGYVMPSF